MLDKYLDEINEMNIKKADFNEYFHKLLDELNTLKDNQRAIFVYSILSAVRDLGYDKGEAAAKNQMKKFLGD